MIKYMFLCAMGVSQISLATDLTNADTWLDLFYASLEAAQDKKPEISPAAAQPQDVNAPDCEAEKAFIAAINAAALAGDLNAMLLIAAHDQNFNQVIELLQQKASANFKDEEGNNALIYALNPLDFIPMDRYKWDLHKTLDLMHDLIDAGTDPQAANFRGETALSLAQKKKNGEHRDCYERIERQIKGAYSQKYYQDALLEIFPLHLAGLIGRYEARIPRSILRFADQTRTDWQLSFGTKAE